MVQPSKSIESVRLERTRGGASGRARDWVTVEEPLEIRVAPSPAGPEASPGAPARSVAVTMRTPGEDFALAAGFLVTEGVLKGREALREITYCRSGRGPQEYNIVEVRLREGVTVDLDRLSRNVYTTSSCGVCGKASLEALEIRGCAPLPLGTLALPGALLAGLPDRLLAAQEDFARTGGIHAAGLFDAAGELVSVHEDVGRHNAVDKAVGAAFLAGELPLLERALVVSGRVSFEVVQKALAAGIPLVAAVGAPSSLAVSLARRFRITLAGFVREGGFNLYSAPERVS
ncbi:MAG: formate dehydrogenase accessory sulfurtransferase FdhD [Longimicrobiales bacterium]|nr:formate dehydrogenase accessory sulfurtransferase FdhD [Longimicrobiales bacterium]